MPSEVPVLSIILPQAYKTVYFYRVYITETVYFKDPVALNVPSIVTPGKALPANGSDRFIYPTYGTGSSLRTISAPAFKNDGSDYREDTS